MNVDKIPPDNVVKTDSIFDSFYFKVL